MCKVSGGVSRCGGDLKVNNKIGHAAEVAAKGHMYWYREYPHTNGQWNVKIMYRNLSTRVKLGIQINIMYENTFRNQLYL